MQDPATSKIDRRRFLLYSSTAALSPAALAAATEVGGRPAAGEPVFEPLAVGYWRGEDGPAADADLPPWPDAPIRVIAAQSLPAGDPRLARTGARIRIHGLLGSAERLDGTGFRSAALQVHFRCAGPALPETVRFSPWSVTTGRHPCAGGAVDFAVPIDADGLELSLDLDDVVTAGDRLRRMLSATTARELTARLELGVAPRRAKLREGVYFIPLKQEAFQSPAALARLDPRTEPCLAFSVEPAGSADSA